MSGDHHSAYLARTVAALTPAGHRRVDKLLDELADAVADRAWLLRFAKARRAEADEGRLDVVEGPDPGLMLTREELGTLAAGFRIVRDQEQLDDVADWANAVLALLGDES